jgi:hypothetical protein
MIPSILTNRAELGAPAAPAAALVTSFALVEA